MKNELRLQKPQHNPEAVLYGGHLSIGEHLQWPFDDPASVERK